nr:Gx transporter family protein [Gammaproteobacteria bacterium]
MNVRKLVTIAVMTSIAIVLSIVESFIPFPIPGVRLGLANIVTLIVLYMYSYKEAVLVQLVRVILVGLIYTGLFSQAFLLSLAGSILSLIVMVSLKLIGRSSIVTISSFSAIFHSLGQIILSSILSSTWGVFLYLPLLSLISILTGVINAVIAIYVLKSFKIEVTKVSIASSITLSIMLVASLTTFIVFKSYKNKDNSLAHITYNNELIMSINLDEPTKFK